MAPFSLRSFAATNLVEALIGRSSSSFVKNVTQLRIQTSPGVHPL